ncbi:MAG: phosphoglycerate kinase [Thermodesulfobacteriota bacterium]|nr:phosphoglycerate kinase [Thermodesulfobacteriota bacterium]
MENEKMDPRLRLIQHADMKGKVVLVRVDHNVVKNGKIKDPYRIDATFGMLYTVAQKGGCPIVMTHIGRPRDKKTGRITCKDGQSVGPIIEYLEQKLGIKIFVPDLPIDPEYGILHVDGSLRQAIEDLKSSKIGMIYLPNSRWFQGEQSSGPERDVFARELADIADIYVNNAFGSWQAHASTYDIAKLLPSFAGILLQKEIMNTYRVLDPESPIVAVIAGAKYDTKIGPLKAIHKKVDHLILGGLMYNTFISAKYGVEIQGVSVEDRALAAELVKLDKKENKIVEMSYVVESEIMDGKVEGKYRTVGIDEIKRRKSSKYLLDIDPRSLDQERVKHVISSARTIFVNAVMGLTPWFFEGTRDMYQLINSNRSAMKLFAGGDTLQELRNLCPGIYLAGLDAPDTYYFTGGGSVLEAIRIGSPYHLKPVEALMEHEA